MKKNMQIEGLRGAACLTIVLFHIFYQYRVYVLQQEGPLLLKYWGEFGVGIFIFISGYFMLDFEGKNFSLSSFYKKRFQRLFPIYALAVSLIFVVRCCTSVSNFDTVTLKDWLLNVLLINGFVGAPYIEPAHWYMTTLIRAIILAGILQHFKLHKHTEVFGVLLCLITGMKVIQKTTSNTLLLALCSIGLNITGGAYTGVFVLAYMMRRLIHCKSIRSLVAENRKELVVIALSIVYLIGLPGLRYTLLILCGGGLVLLCLQERLPFTDNKRFVGVSRISFAWYLTHQYIAYWIEQTLSNKGVSFSMAALIAFIGTGLLAVILHHCIEKPLARIMSNSEPVNVRKTHK